MWNEVCDIYSPDAELDNEPKLYKYTVRDYNSYDYKIDKYEGIVIANGKEEAENKSLKDCCIIYGGVEVEEIYNIDGYKIKLEEIK